jgi:hypothetical protein
MATLSGKTTAGGSAWDKYVSKNPKWKELTLSVENKMEAVMFDTKGQKILYTLKQKETFKLLSKDVVTIGKNIYAQVSYKNKKGLIAISKIRKPTTTDVLKEEAVALESLDKIIKDIVAQVGPFDLRIKNDPKKTVYKDIIGTRNTSEKFLGREAKSDFNITNIKGDAIYISHKKAGGAKAFQQYGGVSKQAGVRIMNHLEVQNFLRMCSQEIERDRLKQPTYSYVKDDDLINYSVFGSEYGKKFGIDNVTIIGQGAAIIKPVAGKEGLFELDFSDHLVHNGDAAEFKKGEYTAILGATFRAGRGFDVDGKRFNGARVGIYPKDMIIKRSGAKEIK